VILSGALIEAVDGEFDLFEITAKVGVEELE
jgi:hypothetical protein